MESTLRAQCNYQKMANGGRWCFLNSSLAGGLANDDRVKSKLSYGQLNAENGIRRWQNLAGFVWVREYPDFPAGGVNSEGNVETAFQPIKSAIVGGF